MYARRAIIYGITIVGAMVFAALALYPLQRATANPKPGVRVANIAATPGSVSPVEVLTVSTTLTNDAPAVDNLTVKMVVRNETGEPVLQERQSGIGLAQDDKRSVYWVWRIPNRLADGPYEIEMSVLNGGENVLAADTKEAAFRVERMESALMRSGR